MPDVVLRLATFSWNGLPIASLALFAFGGLMYLAMSRTPTAATAPQTWRGPGWAARRRARHGIRHSRGRVGVGYRAAIAGAVHLTERELAHHGALFGGPGSGKTTFLELLVEASAGRQPVVILDPKGSPKLADTVRTHGGMVWTLDGTLAADLLDPRPWQVPDLLLEAEDYSADARVYRDAAQQRALWAAWALALRREPMDLQRIRALLDRRALTEALEAFGGRDRRVAEWLGRLRHRDAIDDAGARDLERALGTLLDGVAMRGSLSTGPDAIRLDDVLETRGLLLFSLDVADYPHATRKVAAWVLLGMGRLAHQLPQLVEASAAAPRALLLVDEVGALGEQGRHLRGLVGRARECGLAVVLATQGPSDIEAVDRALLSQVLQDTAWQLAFRQGSPADARHMEALFGQAWIEDVTRWSDGRSSSRKVERPRVAIDEWMNALQPGDAWLRVAPVDQGWRQQRVRVALPRPPDRKQVSETALGNRFGNHASSSRRVVSEVATEPSPRPAGSMRERRAALPSVPPECPQELLERIGTDILAKVEERCASPRRELGPCLVWRDGEPTIKGAGGLYGRIYDPALKRSDAAHLVVWRRCYPHRPIPKGMTVDHLCGVTLCQRPDHLQGPVTRAENTRRARQHARREAQRRQEDAAAASETDNLADVRASVRDTAWATDFAIALFERIDRPAVTQRTVSLDELRQLLSTFDVLDDKRRGRCWSPTKYADGMSSRGNAGVEAVSCLVFDLDRVPPDSTRLEHVCWIGHTTWSHTPSAPRWRVVIPLAQSVDAAGWSDVWRRARAALCPEADPVCSDPSRAYWLPSHPQGVQPETINHDGPLLDPSELPQLPTQPRRSPRKSMRIVGANGLRAEAYMATVITNLEKAAPGGRNAALNRAAWTLAQWVAAGALEQAMVEDALYAAAEQNGLVADDGRRQTWATIRSGLSAGLQQLIGLY